MEKIMAVTKHDTFFMMSSGVWHHCSRFYNRCLTVTLIVYFACNLEPDSLTKALMFSCETCFAFMQADQPHFKRSRMYTCANKLKIAKPISGVHAAGCGGLSVSSFNQGSFHDPVQNN